MNFFVCNIFHSFRTYNRETLGRLTAQSYIRKANFARLVKDKTMPPDELEHLRAILSKSHSKPERANIFGRIASAAKKLLRRPKKIAVTEMEKEVQKRNAA
jgi:hypothetical protein